MAPSGTGWNGHGHQIVVRGASISTSPSLPWAGSANVSGVRLALALLSVCIRFTTEAQSYTETATNLLVCSVHLVPPWLCGESDGLMGRPSPRPRRQAFTGAAGP